MNSKHSPAPRGQPNTIKLCIATEVAVACQEYAEASGFPLNLTQAVNAALRTHVSALELSANKDIDNDHQRYA